MNKDPKKIYLIGFMGSGKSTIGRELAKYLELDFVDLDQMIEDYCLCSIADLFSALGEDHFRKIESQILQDTQSLENVVISLGGGTPCFNENLDFINETGQSIYLQIKPKMLVERLINEKDQRPLISQAKNREELDLLISSKLAVRDSIYKKAHYTVDGNNLIEKIVEEITSLIDS